MKGEIGIGIIGSGFMGRTHAEAIKKYVKRARLVAVAGGKRAGRLAADYGMACDDSVERLCARKDVDAVFITSPHALHHAHALLAAANGKPMLIEKPMASSVEECDDIIDRAKKAGVNCMISFTQRYRKCNVKAKALIDGGAIGRVLQIEDRQLNVNGRQVLPAWQQSPENIGILYGNGVHNLDRVRWLTGSEPKTVYARSGSLLDPKASIEWTTMAIVTMKNGVEAMLWTSFEIPGPGFPRANFMAWVVGEKGLLDLDAYGELRASVGGKPWEVVEKQEPIDWAGKGQFDPVRMQSYILQNQEFIDSVLDQRPSAVTGFDGRQAVAMALAAYESSRTGRPVDL